MRGRPRAIEPEVLARYVWVVAEREVLGATRSEVAARLGVSPERIRQVEGLARAYLFTHPAVVARLLAYARALRDWLEKQVDT